MSERDPLLGNEGRSRQFRRSLTLSVNITIPGDTGHNLRGLREDNEQPAATAATPGDSRAQISKKQFFMQIVRASVGTGVLALPAAVSDAGLVFGMVGILLVSLIVMDSAHLMIDSAQLLRRRYGLENVDLDYGNTAECAFANGPAWSRRLRWTSKLLYFCLAINHLGICSVYILFIAENVKYLVEYFESSFQQPLFVYLIIVTLLIAPLTFIRSLRVLSNMSGFGNIFMLVALGLILFYCCQDIPDVTQYPYITDMKGIPYFIGVTMFSFGTIEIILPNENALDDKESLRGYGGLLNLCFVVVLVINFAVAFFGYAKFGKNVKGSLTNSLPMSPWYYMIVKPMYAFLVFLTFDIQFFVYLNIIWQALRPRVTDRMWLRHVCAVVSLAVMLGCAATVPHVEHMISLIGSLSGAAVWIVFPVVVHTAAFWDHQPSYQRFQLMIVKNFVVLCFGLFGGVVGSYSNILALSEAFHGKSDGPDIPAD